LLLIYLKIQINGLIMLKLRGNVGTQGNGAPRYALNSVFVASPDFTPTGSYPIQFPFGGVAGFSTGNTNRKSQL
jgi:hypothetical protein